VVDDANFVLLSQLVVDDKLNSTAAKEVLSIMLVNGGNPEQIATDRNLIQVSDTGLIETIVDEVLADSASQQAAADVKAGEMKAIGYLVGQIMKRSQGKANPKMAQDMLRKKLGL
jgi:aspartyl-tRNA(Asn)/glutamyl-tRNA(Gln) amidotransferase subunit B